MILIYAFLRCFIGALRLWMLLLLLLLFLSIISLVRYLAWCLYSFFFFQCLYYIDLDLFMRVHMGKNGFALPLSLLSEAKSIELFPSFFHFAFFFATPFLVDQKCYKIVLCTFGYLLDVANIPMRV